MSETETATASSASASSPAQKTASQPARTRRESRGWLALVFQILAFAAAGVAGFAASHYLTTQQLPDTARQQKASQADSSVPAMAPSAAERLDEAAARQRPFSEEVERAEVINAQDVDQLTPLLIEPTLESTEGLPFDQLPVVDGKSEPDSQ